MTSYPEFSPPVFLQNIGNVEDLHQELLDRFPSTYDKTAPGFIWDFTRPQAELKEEMLNFYLVEAIKLLFPAWAYDVFLDMHAWDRKIYRKNATRATGYLNVEGKAGTTIPSGTIVKTTSTEYNTSILFITLDEVVVDTTGTGTTRIECVESGVIGNVKADTIVLFEKPIEGITKIYNKLATSGGVEIEDDESLRQRIKEHDENLDISFTNCDWDFKRWSLEVDAVGDAIVIPAQRPDTVVTIVLIDSNGDPANEEIRQRVYDHIMADETREEDRLASINTILKLIPAELVLVDITADVMLEIDGDIEKAKSDFINKVNKYFIEAMEEKEIRISEVGGALINADGIDDYFNLRINNDIENIPLNIKQLPRTNEVIFNEV